MTISDAYARASKVFELLTSGQLSVEMAHYRLEEVNAASGIHIRCDLPYLTEIKTKQQASTVFTAMKEPEEDYESSEEYESSDD